MPAQPRIARTARSGATPRMRITAAVATMTNRVSAGVEPMTGASSRRGRMNMTMMTYKGYEAAVEYDEDAGIFHGEVINLRDVGGGLVSNQPFGSEMRQRAAFKQGAKPASDRVMCRSANEK